MVLDKNIFNIRSISYTNLIFAFLPISFILGNFIINLNLILLCILGIFHLKSKILTTKLDFTLKIIFLLFIVVFFSTSLSFIKSIYFDGYEQNNLTRLIKSVFFFRFYIFLLIIYLLSEYNLINFKYFFLSAALSSFLISVDVIFQYSFGFNIIGLESYGQHNTSFFGDELISGGFIQNFSFFAILLASYLLKNNRNYSRVMLIAVTICTLCVGIMVSGNRMPFLLFLFGLFLVYFFNKKLRKIILSSSIILLIVLGAIIPTNNQLKINFMSLYGNGKETVRVLFERIKASEEEVMKKEKEQFLNESAERDGYTKIISTGIETWKLHKVFGNGIKAFREDCMRIIEEQKRGACANHPHNYHLEILTDLGILGFLFTTTLALIFILFLIKNYKFLSGENLANLFLLAAIISLVLEVFPIKSTGSIFSTNNTAYVTLMSGIILSRKKILEGKNFG